MYRVMIVDDEPYIRHMLREMVDWRALGYDLCAEAYNGRDALEKIQAATPRFDLVITDIKMPVKDGLTLIREAAALDGALVFAVISAFDDFHLVKDAFKLGAKEYLLKSEMTGEQLAGVLGGIKRHLSQPPRGTRHAQPAGEHRQGMINITLCGGAGAPDMQACLRLLDEAITSTAGQLRYAHFFHCDIMQADVGELNISLYYGMDETEPSIRQQLLGIKRHMDEHGARVNMGVSDFYAGEGDLTRQVYESQLANDACFLTGSGSMNHYAQLKRGAGEPLEAGARVERLRRALLLRHRQAVAADVQALLVDGKRATVEQIPEIRELYMRYCFALSEYAQGSGPPALFRELERYNNELRFRGDLDALNQWLCGAFEQLGGREGIFTLIQRVKYFIEENFHEDISLSSTADHFEMNSSYLSRLFSQQAGISFLDYVTTVRINRALELMQSTNLKLYEIGERVGYVNPEHFSRAFRKATGKSPKQYMKREG